ncbi:MAG: hypothetical protein HKO95_06705 [Rhodobacteraceae bacterium]|nr:hypothetical protein [Alphaproteobacteria bacterium]NNK66411.1 hypothetical protein [Paracoccaceae bacterium]
MTTRIDFAGQLGGKDAQPFFLPHFKALKRACVEFTVRGLNVIELTYILRIDGEVSTYGGSGVGPIIIDRNENRISVDIEISIDERQHLEKAIPTYLSASVTALQEQIDDMDVGLFESDLKKFTSNYLHALASQDRT